MSRLTCYGVIPKGLLTFLGFFFSAMRSLVPVGHFRNISGHLFTWLVCRCFQWLHGLLFNIVSCEITRKKLLVLKDQLNPLRMMEYRVSKALTVLIIAAFIRHQLSIVIFFSLLSMKYDVKIQNAAIWDKIIHSKSRTLFFEGRLFFFALPICLSKGYTKVPMVFFRNFFVKTTKES